MPLLTLLQQPIHQLSSIISSGKIPACATAAARSRRTNITAGEFGGQRESQKSHRESPETQLEVAPILDDLQAIAAGTIAEQRNNAAASDPTSVGEKPVSAPSSPSIAVQIESNNGEIASSPTMKDAPVIKASHQNPPIPQCPSGSQSSRAPIKEEMMDLDYLCDRELVQESYDQDDENVINFGVQTKGDDSLKEISAQELQGSLTLGAP
ncbi:OLC1v1036771C1 [Oldenlandia corymbosa var. corymbosa]|uniref:OLC1v1036771C1 n=1 Tax=Oldenlandia corymbosa var. corymbosa TaxID=529605 RepID=A0AAV1CX05_OLDCO|nr:OLC1v1036771C1 [Oldenlandia corymbosa var. corymbosa]